MIWKDYTDVKVDSIVQHASYRSSIEIVDVCGNALFGAEDYAALNQTMVVNEKLHQSFKKWYWRGAHCGHAVEIPYYSAGKKHDKFPRISKNFRSMLFF